MYTKGFSNWPAFINEFAPYRYSDKTAECKCSRPAVNIAESNENFTLSLAAPGLSKDDFKIKVEENVLSISVDKEVKDASYTKKEFGYEKFERSFELGEKINQDAIDAKYQDGILELTLGKKEEAKQKPAREIAIA